MRRRDALRGIAAAAISIPAWRPARAEGAPPAPETDLAAIEKRVGGRLGVAALETASGRRLLHREDDRFPLCSTFKWLLAARVLARVDAGQEQLTRFVPYGPGDLLEYAPITREHVKEGGLSVSALAEAAVEASDNTAANLLLVSIGGPAGLTAYLREIGDPETRLDRKEPELNSAIPSDPRDTTTPAAMVSDVQALLLGSRLTAPSRERLIGWLVGSTTGGARLRAGVPREWRVGDKTGTGNLGSTNDVAILWPRTGAPILVAAYLTDSHAEPAAREAALADVGRAVARWAQDLRGGKGR